MRIRCLGSVSVFVIVVGNYYFAAFYEVHGASTCSPGFHFPVETSAPPFGLPQYISIFYRNGKICFHAQLPSKSFRPQRKIPRLRSILWATGSERRVSSGRIP